MRWLYLSCRWLLLFLRILRQGKEAVLKMATSIVICLSFYGCFETLCWRYRMKGVARFRHPSILRIASMIRILSGRRVSSRGRLRDLLWIISQIGAALLSLGPWMMRASCRIWISYLILVSGLSLLEVSMSLGKKLWPILVPKYMRENLSMGTEWLRWSKATSKPSTAAKSQT